MIHKKLPKACKYKVSYATRYYLIKNQADTDKYGCYYSTHSFQSSIIIPT